MLQTEHVELRFKVKEGVGNVWINAEPQSENGEMPCGLTGMGFTLYANDNSEAERVADFFTHNVRQGFFVKAETKCVK